MCESSVASFGCEHGLTSFPGVEVHDVSLSGGSARARSQGVNYVIQIATTRHRARLKERAGIQEYLLEMTSADKSELIPGVDGETIIQVVIPTQTSKAMPSASTVVSSEENDLYLRQTRWLGHDAAKGTLKAEVSFLRGQIHWCWTVWPRQHRLSSGDTLAQHIVLSHHLKEEQYCRSIPPIDTEWLMTDSWKCDETTSAVQMMDTTHVPCITRDDSEEHERSLRNQQVRRPRACRLWHLSSSARRRTRIWVSSPKRFLSSSSKSIVTCTPVRTVMSSQTSMRQVTVTRMRPSSTQRTSSSWRYRSLFNVEGNDALKEDAEERITNLHFTSSRTQLAQTKWHGTAKQYTGHGVMRSSRIRTGVRLWLLMEKSTLFEPDQRIRPRKDEGNCRGTPKKCGGGTCYGTGLLSRRAGTGVQGRWRISPFCWFCASSTKRQLLHSLQALNSLQALTTKTMTGRRWKFEMSRQRAPSRMTTRPFSQGPYSGSACGRQHEGVVSLVSAGVTPGSAINRQGSLHGFRWPVGQWRTELVDDCPLTRSTKPNETQRRLQESWESQTCDT